MQAEGGRLVRRLRCTAAQVRNVAVGPSSDQGRDTGELRQNGQHLVRTGNEVGSSKDDHKLAHGSGA